MLMFFLILRTIDQEESLMGFHFLVTVTFETITKHCRACFGQTNSFESRLFDAKPDKLPS